LLTLALAWLGLELGLRKVPDSYSVKRDGLRAIATKVDTLILGSSETYYGISAHELLGTAFNLANSAQTLHYDYELAKRVLPELPVLRRAFILANYMSLYAELDDHPDSWRQYEYQRIWGIPLQDKNARWDVRSVSLVAVYSPHTAIEALVHRFNMSLAPRVDDRGWYHVPLEDRWGLGVKEANGRLAVHHGFMRKEHFAANEVVLDQLVGLLREHGVEVVMLTTPVWSTYRAGMRQELWQPEKAVFEQIARKYGVRYLNLQNDPRMTAEDFEDSDHLNAEGAAHFSHLLNETLGAPGDAPSRVATGI
jgi:hypothetical protein